MNSFVGDEHECVFPGGFWKHEAHVRLVVDRTPTLTDIHIKGGGLVRVSVPTTSCPLHRFRQTPVAAIGVGFERWRPPGHVRV